MVKFVVVGARVSPRPAVDQVLRIARARFRHSQTSFPIAVCQYRLGKTVWDLLHELSDRHGETLSDGILTASVVSTATIAVRPR